MVLDWVMTTLYVVYMASLLLSAAMANANLVAIKSRQLGLFAPFLVLLFIQELSVYIFFKYNPDRSTAVVYNIYRAIAASFFAVLYYRLPLNASFRKPILVLLTTYLLATVFIFGFIQSIYTFNNYIYLGGGLVITCCALIFLFNYFKLDNPKEEKKWLPVLWISIGIVIFYPVVNISFALYKHIQGYSASMFGIKLYQVIPRIMSIFMYGCFAWAFYLCKKRNWT